MKNWVKNTTRTLGQAMLAKNFKAASLLMWANTAEVASSLTWANTAEVASSLTWANTTGALGQCF